jgi:hypothetical protein
MIELPPVLDLIGILFPWSAAQSVWPRRDKYSAACDCGGQAIDAMRGNMLQGTNLGQVIAPMGILLAWLVVPFAVSLKHLPMEIRSRCRRQSARS